MNRVRMAALNAWRSAISRGIGYEPQPIGRHFENGTDPGYFVDFRAKTANVDKNPIEVRLPASLAQVALGYYERLLEGDTGASAEFDRCCALLASRAEPSDRGLLWAYDMPVAKYSLEPRWHSAMAQGQAASVFVRAARRTRDDRFAELAIAAIEPLLDTRAGLVVLTEDGPVLEEAPSKPPSRILNGWIYAAWGLFDVARAFSDSRVAVLLEETIRCLRASFDYYDTGWWTRYSLYPHRTPDLAKPFYHRVHTVQSEVLYRLYGYEEFGAAARRWASYDSRWHRTAVVAQKGMFVARGR